MNTDADLIARSVITLKIGDSIHLDRKMVLVAVDDKTAKLLPIWPHEQEEMALPSYRASLTRGRKYRAKRGEKNPENLS